MTVVSIPRAVKQRLKVQIDHRLGLPAERGADSGHGAFGHQGSVLTQAGKNRSARKTIIDGGLKLDQHRLADACLLPGNR